MGRRLADQALPALVAREEHGGSTRKGCGSAERGVAAATGERAKRLGYEQSSTIYAFSDPGYHPGFNHSQEMFLVTAEG